MCSYIKYLSFYRAKEQTKAFLEGFWQVVPQPFLIPFQAEEFEALMFGLKSINLDDWKQNTFYKGKYGQKGAEHPIIKWFWKEMELLSQEEL